MYEHVIGLVWRQGSSEQYILSNLFCFIRLHINQNPFSNSKEIKIEIDWNSQNYQKQNSRWPLFKLCKHE